MPLSRHSVETYTGSELTSNLSGNIQPQSSQLAEPLWTDPGLKSEISVRELISATEKNKIKKRWRGMNGRKFSKVLAREEKAVTLKPQGTNPIGIQFIGGSFLLFPADEVNPCFILSLWFLPD